MKFDLREFNEKFKLSKSKYQEMRRYL